MKKVVLLLILCIGWIASSCTSDEKLPASDVVTLASDVYEIDAPAEGGVFPVKISVQGSMKEWNSLVPSGEWVYMYPNHESFTTENKWVERPVNIYVSENTADDARTQNICIYTLYDRISVTVNQDGLNRKDCVALDRQSVDFAVNDYGYKPVSLSAYEDVELTLPDASWLQTAEVPQGDIAQGDQVQFYVAPESPSAADRKAEIVFKGKKTGKVTVLSVTQQAAPVVNGFPARWDYTTAFAKSCGWTETCVAAANYDSGKDAATVTAVGVNNRRLDHVIAESYVASVGVSKMYTGDYLLFSVPVKSLPAGCGVDVMLTIAGDNNDCPKYWIAEIYDGGEWCKPQASDLKQIGGEDYSFYTKYFSAYQHCTFLQSFTLKNAVSDDFVKVRCRVVGDKSGNDGTLLPDNKGTVYLSSRAFHFATLAAYPDIALKGKKKVAILGNSFTYYYSTHYLLKELARSNGYQLDIRTCTKGSQTLGNHLALERSEGVASETGYDYVFLQDQSTAHSEYAQSKTESTLNNTKKLSARFRNGSPDAKIILENTWAFPASNWQSNGSSDAFEALLLEGCRSIVTQDPNCDAVSPIGVAFNTAYAEGITSLWHTDNKHPNRNGAYLKACVNYLVMFGEPFAAGTSDGGCEHNLAVRLRRIAEQTVLGHEADYYIVR